MLGKALVGRRYSSGSKSRLSVGIHVMRVLMVIKQGVKATKATNPPRCYPQSGDIPGDRLQYNNVDNWRVVTVSANHSKSYPLGWMIAELRCALAEVIAEPHPLGAGPQSTIPGSRYLRIEGGHLSPFAL